MGQKVIIMFGGNLGYRLHAETISPLFADISSTTYASDCVPPLFTLSETLFFVLSVMADQHKC